MKKAVVLSGTQPEDTAGAAVHQTFVDELARNDWDVSPFLLHEIDVRRCLGRFGCWLETPGRCVMRDADQVASAMARSDLNVYLTPTTFGEYSSHLKKVLHRSIFLILPFFQKVDRETHHVPRYRDRGDLLVIGLTGQRDPGCDAVFRALAK